MAYGVKYKFIFESINGAETEIDVLKDGYSGSPIQRPLGSAPVLRQQKNDRVSGSSLAFSPECQVDGEFTEFYTTDPFQYKVNLYRANNLIWSGFITPELYSEPDIAPPYDVNVTATDGLGELRRTTFNPIGKVTLHALFVNLLSYTGQSLDVNYISRLAYSGVAYNAFFVNTYIDVDYKAGESCYDVLQYILTTFNAVICFYNGAWMIVRENDVTLTSGKPDYIKANGTAGTLTGGHMEIGSMTTPGKLWPVNFTSTAVDPALRRMAVEAPWNLVSGLLNSDMLSDASWTKSGSASYNAALGGYSLLPQAYIQQSITQKMGKPFLLTFDAAAYIYRPGNVQKYSQAIVEVKFVSGGSTWYAAEDENGGIYWNTEASDIKFRIESGDSRATATENQVNVPVATDSNGNVLTGTLTVKISADTAQGLRLFGAWLTIAAEKGWKDNIEIDNDARGDASDVTIAIGYETNDISDYKKYYGGILLTANDALVTALSTQNFSNLDFLSLISRDFARSIASPRLRTTGTLNTPSSLALRPLLVTHRSSLCWLETFEWNLYMDDLDFAAVSVPTGTISVSGEVITATGSASGSPDKTIGRLTPGTGEEGQDGITIFLSSYAHCFAAGSTGYAESATDSVNVIAYRGNTRVATTVGTITGAPSGLTVSKVNNGTTNTVLWINAGTSLHEDGNVTIPVTADGVTVNLSYGWTLAAKGQNGSPGADAPVCQFPFAGDWSADGYYAGTTTLRSIVKYNGVYYRAKADMGEIHESTPPSSSSKWESIGTQYENIATGFLFTEEAVIQNAIIQILRTAGGSGSITAEGNALSMFDSNGKLRLKISGDDITGAGSVQSINVPNGTGGWEAVSDTDALQGYTYNLTGTLGTFSPTAASNSMEIPSIQCQLALSGRVTSGTVRARATLRITVDGIPAAEGVGGWTSLSSPNSSASQSFTIPATSLSLSVGSHTIGWSLTLETLARTGYESQAGDITVSGTVTQAAVISLGYAQQISEIGPNGLRVMFSSTQLFQCLKSNGSVQLLLQNGSYGLEVTDSALRLRIGGTWYTAGTATISGNTVLKLT